MGLSGKRVCVVLRLFELISCVPVHSCSPHVLGSVGVRVYGLGPLHNLVFVVIIDENVDIWVVCLEPVDRDTA